MRLLFFKKRRQANLKLRNFVTYTHPKSRISEQFRSIQTNIALATSEMNKNIFLVTSAKRGEGKSTIAINLAISMVSAKRKVLFIDANLRNPSAHEVFKLANNHGLTEVLSGKSDFKEAVAQTEIANLEVLTSGITQVNPVEMIGSHEMQELLARARQHYHLIIVDSPAILEVTDTKLLANRCDGILLVVQRRKTQVDDGMEVKKMLEFAKDKILGVIINK